MKNLLLISLFILIVGCSAFQRSQTSPIDSDEYYGFFTQGSCKIDSDCMISGCNAKVCQSKNEESIGSVCILPDKPAPKQLNYVCKCNSGKCSWSDENKIFKYAS